MKKLLLLSMVAGSAIAASAAIPTKTVTINGTDYEVQTLIQRPIGPGMTYTRLRVPQFPLNVNMVTVDTRNPNIKIETTLSNDHSDGVELLVEAAKRHDSQDHHAVAAQNGNFWIVSSQEYWEPHGATPHGVAMRNGILSADSKDYPFWWDRQNEQGEWILWGSKVVGIIGATEDNELWIGGCETEMTFKSDKLGIHEIANCNRGFRPGKMTIYTPWFKPEREFVPLASESRWDQTIDYNAVCTEVLCSIAEGEEWGAAKDIKFVVKEIRSGNGHGKRGDYDLAVVARTADFNFDKLVPGDEISINYSWVFNKDGKDVRPAVLNAIGGNVHIMKDGQITEHNYWDSYNTMVYSRSAYGTSQDNNTLYMITIDKSTDPVYGASNGCTTEEMCQLVKEFGVWNMVNVDAGGSAELMVDNRIINKTTEGTPRAVNNGWMVFNTSPDNDNRIAELAFYDIDLSAPALTSFTPRVIALNQYGTIINDDYKDFEVTTESDLGYASGSSFICGEKAGDATITITAPGVKSASRTLSITAATPHLLLSKIVIDNKHTYLMEVQSEANGKTFLVEPYKVRFTSDNPEVADINEHGILYAIKNGTCNLNAKIADMDETIPVSVENADGPSIELFKSISDWKLTLGAGLKIGTPAEDGTIPYTYNAPRGVATIKMGYGSKELYGLPIALEIEFQSTLPVKSLTVGLRPQGEKRANQTIEPAEEFAANAINTATLPVSMFGDPAYVGNYPLTLADIVFNITPKTEYKGEQSINIRSIRAIYGEEGGVMDIVADAQGNLTIAPNPVEPGAEIALNGINAAKVEIYNGAGLLLSAAENASALRAPAASGLYLVRATAADGKVCVGRLIVK